MGVEVVSHGARHIQSWSRINTGIRIRYTGAAASLALHPIHALWRAGLHLSFHTDNRLMSRVDQSTEAARLVQAGFGWDELVQMGLDAAAASFLPAPARAAAQAALDSWAAAQGIAPPQRA